MTDIQKIISLCKRRGFIYPSSLIYGGMANSWDFGPLGVELIENIKRAWWDRFVRSRTDMVGISSAIIMNPEVWKSSGHLSGFSDPLVECKKCHSRHRGDHVGESCPSCGEKDSFTPSRDFNLMFKTFIGPVEGEGGKAYLRPETAQGMFVNFKNILTSTRRRLPFGVAQTGKAFRNEITPGNYIFRTREFEQMEIEYFIEKPETDKQWEEVFEHWRNEMLLWIDFLGISRENIVELNVPAEDLAHYSKKTIDFEYRFPFGVKELYGLAYRTDFDLKNHEEHSGENMKYRHPDTGEEQWAHVIEPTFGVERTVLAVLVEHYAEEEDRVVMRFPSAIAPIKVAVLPLVKKQSVRATEIYQKLSSSFACDYDEGGSIGRRYRRQDEIGTPLCITVDFEEDSVTLRYRDSMEQIRVNLDKLEETITKTLNSQQMTENKNSKPKAPNPNVQN